MRRGACRLWGKSAKLRVFPMYPTLRAYVRLLLDSPEYFTAFWNSMIQTILVLAGQLLAAVPAAWAFAQFRFRGKGAVVSLYASDDPAVSGNNAVKLFNIK